MFIFQQALYLLLAHSPFDEEDGARGMVVAADEGLEIGSGVVAQALWVAEDIAAKRMMGKEECLEIIKDEFCGRVVVALYLIDDDLAFLLEFILRKGAVEDDVEQQGDGTTEVGAQEGGIVDGLFFARIGVEVAAHTFHAVEDLHGGEAGGALEGHVFDEMRHTALAVEFGAGASGYSNAGVDDITLRRDQDDTEAGG